MGAGDHERARRMGVGQQFGIEDGDPTAQFVFVDVASVEDLGEDFGLAADVFALDFATPCGRRVRERSREILAGDRASEPADADDQRGEDAEEAVIQLEAKALTRPLADLSRRRER